MSAFKADVRFAWRMLLRKPGFTTLAVGILALGIGATTAIFSAVNPILFEALPYPNADQLMMVWEDTTVAVKSNVGYQTFANIAEQNHSFASLAAMSYATATMTGKGEAVFLNGQRVSPAFFTVLQVQPAIGRGFRDEDNLRGTQRVIVLSNGLWRSRFGGDSSVVGKPIVLDGNDVVVVGVMPASFENVLSPTAQFWVPLRYDVSLPQACRSCRHLRVVARRKEGVSATRAAADVNAIFARLVKDFPKEYSHPGMFVPLLAADVVHGVRPALLAVLGAVGLVLLVACLNVMNLLIARGVQREAEFSVRAALGVGRGRIVRQLLAESLLLSLFGGVTGVVVALVGVRVLVGLSPANLPRLSAIHVNGAVLAFAISITTLVAIIFGLVPGLFATRSNLQHAIRRSGPRGARGSRVTRSMLVISEVALASVLLVASGLLYRSMKSLFQVNPGFDTRQLLTMRIQSGSGKLRNDALVEGFWNDALQKVRSQPGVMNAALTSQMPLGDEYDSYGIKFESKLHENPADAGGGFRYAVSDGYFETMKIPLVKGRYFTAQDREQAPLVAILNASFAKQEFGDTNPIGQRIKVGGDDRPWREVIGIVGDVRQTSLASTNVNAFYIPERQWFFTDDAMTLVVRAQQNALSLVAQIRASVWSVDKDQPFIRIATADKLMADTAAERRFALVLFESFAVLALVLAAAGIYGVLAGTVGERIRELGVRSALGASSVNQIAMVMRQGLALTLVGVALGLVAALVSTRIIAGMLFAVSPVDPITYITVSGTLLVITLLACWIPARRASHASPMEALRAE